MMKQRSEGLYWVTVGVLALLAGFIVFNATAQYGIGLSQDSVVYIAAAQNLVTGQGLSGLDGNPVTLWPPLYPSLLAFFVWLLKTDVVVVARYLNVLFSFLVVLLAGVYARQLRLSPIPALGATAMTAWGYALVATRIMAWTEPLFVALALIALISLNRYITRSGPYALILFVIAAALAAVTRYIGIILIPVGVLVYLLFARNRWAARLATALGIILAAALPLALVLARNWMVSGALMGPRHPPTISLLYNIASTARVLAGWFLPSSLSDDGFVVLIGVLLIQLILVAVFLAYTRRQEPGQSAFRLYVPTVLYIVGYVAFLLYTTTTTNLNAVDDRYLIPIFVPLLMIVFGCLNVILEAAQARIGRTTANVVAALVLGLALAWPLRVTLLGMQHWRENGEGFSAAIWNRNETIQYLKDNQSLLADRIIYSNYPHTIFAQFRLESQSVPYHYYVGSTRVLRELSQLESEWPAGEAVIVWFDWGDWQTHLFRPEELSTISDMSEIAVTADGAIWQASPLP